jgi:molecular chaperone GrpE
MSTEERPHDEEVPAPGADASGEAPAGAEEIRRLEAELEEARERLRRAAAEFSNEVKRIRRSAEESGKYAIESLIKGLLPMFDALNAAREGLPEGADPALRRGFDLVEDQLLQVLSRHGVVRIVAAEEPFDPAQHEAVVVVSHPTLGPGTVSRELRPGFTLHGRVVRPAQVEVVAEGGPVPSDDGAKA